MKWYWHLLALILSAIAAWFAGDWLSQPLWQIVEPHPVSFDQCKVDRKEWTTLVGDEERKNWWIETRAGRDPTVIRRLKLELPPLTGEYPYFGASIGLLKMSCDAVLSHEYVRVGNSNARAQIEFRYCILDPTTGKLLRRFIIPNNPIDGIAGHGSKLAFVENETIKLFDVSTKIERSIKVTEPVDLTFSPDGRLLACVDRESHQFYFIDWDKGLLVKALGREKHVESFSFVSNNVVLFVFKKANQEAEHSRWHWDGVSLKQISPGIKMPNNQVFPFLKGPFQSELHVSTLTLRDWHSQLKPIFQWLADKKLPIERWVPKQYFRRWVVLDDQDHIKREYYEGGDRTERHALYDHFSVEVEPAKQYATSTITFWNEHPIWPNALAVGVVFYLMLYVMMLVCRRLRIR